MLFADILLNVRVDDVGVFNTFVSLNMYVNRASLEYSCVILFCMFVPSIHSLVRI